jgi:hypothetical protein
LGSQFFSFLATKAHFSSNWASRVFGGKSHELVVEVAGMLAGDSAQTADRAAIYVAKSTCLTYATPLGDVIEHRFQLLRRNAGVKVRCPFSLGKTDLANATPEHSPLLMRAVATGHGEISGRSFAMLGAIGIEAAEVREVIHDAAPPL